jgi:PilZ domain-containing protein
MHALDSVRRRSDPMEHRWGERIPLEVPVSLWVDGRLTGRGLLRNASISGAFIETSLELPTFSPVTVTFSKAAAHVGVEGAIVRAETGGLAIEWRDMACADIVALLERTCGRRECDLRDDPAYKHA